MLDLDWQFTLVLITNGVMIGLMYTLIALGFVLVYKATDAINFAQGEFVMFAGFIAAAGAYFAGLPFAVCALLAVGGMAAFGFGLERVVLRPLIGRPVVAVIMATLLSFAVARTITSPLAAITDVMRQVAATGDLTRKIAVRKGNRWDDEDAP